MEGEVPKPLQQLLEQGGIAAPPAALSYPCFPRSLWDIPASLCWDGAQGEESRIHPNSWSREEATEAGGDRAAAQCLWGVFCREPKEEEEWRAKGFPGSCRRRGQGEGGAVPRLPLVLRLLGS